MGLTWSVFQSFVVMKSSSRLRPEDFTACPTCASFW